MTPLQKSRIIDLINKSEYNTIIINDKYVQLESFKNMNIEYFELT